MEQRGKQGRGHNGRHQGGVAAPVMPEHGAELQDYGQVIPMPLELSEKVCLESVNVLNQILADTMTLRDLYKKHHWQVSGVTFYQLHLLYDKHYKEQSELVDEIAERIQLLGGISVAMAPDIAELTRIQRPPRGREDVPVQIARLLDAHKAILRQARDASEKRGDAGDVGTQDLLISSVVRTNELQTWFLAEHLVPTKLVEEPDE
jgi:starvation-inducible DNA-binding protein